MSYNDQSEQLRQLLLHHPLLRQFGVRDVWLIEADEGLVVKQQHHDGTVDEITLTGVDWRAALQAGPEQFANRIAGVLPRKWP